MKAIRNILVVGLLIILAAACSDVNPISPGFDDEADDTPSTLKSGTSQNE